MSLEPIEARDEMLELFRLAWLAGNPEEDLDTSELPVSWPDLPFKPPGENIAWARVTLRTATGKQATLAGEEGSRRFNRTGVVIIQLFVPIADGMKMAYKLVKIVMGAYEGKATPGGVWFRNTRFNEVGIDGAWHQINVITDFNYDEVK
jgi:hypothetical protein